MKNIKLDTFGRLRKRQVGVAAVELALLLPILITFLTLGYFTVSIFWHYTMAQKAAQDAARYLSTVPASEMMAPASASAAGSLAQQIARKEIADMSPDAVVPGIETFCDDSNCGLLPAGQLPTTVRVKLSVTMFDPSGIVDTGWYGLLINANYTMRYVNK
jgi:Flp pilus assembly protein TadG